MHYTRMEFDPKTTTRGEHYKTKRTLFLEEWLPSWASNNQKSGATSLGITCVWILCVYVMPEFDILAIFSRIHAHICPLCTQCSDNVSRMPRDWMERLVQSEQAWSSSEGMHVVAERTCDEGPAITNIHREWDEGKLLLLLLMTSSRVKKRRERRSKKRPTGGEMHSNATTAILLSSFLCAGNTVSTSMTAAAAATSHQERRKDEGPRKGKSHRLCRDGEKRTTIYSTHTQFTCYDDVSFIFTPFSPACQCMPFAWPFCVVRTCIWVSLSSPFVYACKRRLPNLFINFFAHEIQQVYIIILTHVSCY